MREVREGDVLNHLYQVRRFIARGGMGQVFEGVNINNEDERVAIKVILPHLARCLAPRRRLNHAEIRRIWPLKQAQDRMNPTQTISIDAMGGDRGPAAVVAGLSLSVRELPNTDFLLHGNFRHGAPHAL